MVKQALLGPFQAISSTGSGIPHKCNSQNLRFLLSSCKELKSLLQIHGQLVISGFKQDLLLSTHLINSYSLFHRCDLARLVFTSLPNPSVILGNSVIRAYTRSKKYTEALQIYHNMLETGFEPDKYTFTFALKACTGAFNLEEGVSIHRQIARRKLEFNVFIGTGLIDMYCKTGDLKSALKVFDNMPEKDVVAWNAIIAGLSQSSKPFNALEFFRIMQMDNTEPNSVSLLNLVPAVSKLADITSCRSIHGYVVRRDFGSAISNGLIDMYSKCGDMKVARQVFDRMSRRDDVSWGTMIAGYFYNGYFSEVLSLFDCIKGQNLKMNKVSILSAVMAAGKMKDLERGKEIHNFALQQGIDLDISLTTSVITMYVRCEGLEKGKKLFEKTQRRDVIAWSAFISACAQSGYYEEALSQFREMQNEIVKPDLVTLVSILPLCAELLCLKIGKSIHCFTIKADLDSDISIGTALVSMYSKCRHFSLALILFNRLSCKDVITWNALISGYSQMGESNQAILTFRKLLLSGNIYPDAGTMSGLIQSCALLSNLNLGTCIHGQTIKLGFELDSYIKSALIHMYSKCGSLSSAELVFKTTDFTKDVVSWNAIISGYMQNGNPRRSIRTFLQMKLDNIKPNLATFVSILPAVAYSTSLRLGMAIHSCIIQMGFLTNRLVANSLIAMYAKCGPLNYSERVFDEIEDKDTVSYNAMLAGYAIHGQGDSALALFYHMQESSQVQMDSVSFLSVLSICRHVGLVNEGKVIFRSMCERHCLQPNVEHYACMVDLLGRACLFDEALNIIDEMPMEPDGGVWGALLGACRMHCNVKLGEVVMDHLEKLEPRNSTNYVVLLGLYADSGRWHSERMGRLKMKESGLKKIPGCSWVEVKNIVQKSTLLE